MSLLRGLRPVQSLSGCGETLGSWALTFLKAGDVADFLLNILPKGFVRIRHYGFLAKGIPIARRTVAKYRNELKIPSSTVRRRSLFPGALK